MTTLALIDVPGLLKEYRMTRSTLYRYIRAGTFPQPYQELRTGKVWDRAVIEKHLGKPPSR